jgi:hypothetical protein
MWCSPIEFAEFQKQIWIQGKREKWRMAFLKADTHWDCVQASAVHVVFLHIRVPVSCRVQFYLILCLLLFVKQNKKK